MNFGWLPGSTGLHENTMIFGPCTTVTMRCLKIHENAKSVQIAVPQRLVIISFCALRSRQLFKVFSDGIMVTHDDLFRRPAAFRAAVAELRFAGRHNRSLDVGPPPAVHNFPSCFYPLVLREWGSDGKRSTMTIDSHPISPFPTKRQ